MHDARMYDLPYFKERDEATVLDFVRQHPFATLIGCSDGVPVATQVPLLLHIGEEGGLFVRGHIMRKSEHHRTFEKNPEVLCLFSGAHTYVSARWYSNPQTASTWNYMSVHTWGTLRFLDEPELRRLLEDLTAHFENDDESPSLFRHLPADYVDALVKAIIGFEIEVREVKNVFKLSQNRDEQSYDNIIRNLDAHGGDGRTIADEMRKRKGNLFVSSAGNRP
jgi:transcriptional regulator